MARKKQYLSKRALVAALIIIIVAGLIALIREGHQPKAVSGTIPSTTKIDASKPSVGAVDKTQSNSSIPSSSTNSSSTPTSSAGTTLSQGPSGSFVSNHKPSLSGSTTPSQEESLCNTVPGASCYIEFTQGSVVKKLDSRVADASGTVIWDWDVNNAGFTTGSWTIKAIATLDGHTKSTSDPLAFEVQE